MPKGDLFEDEKQIIKTRILYNNNNKILREIFL